MTPYSVEQKMADIVLSYEADAGRAQPASTIAAAALAAMNTIIANSAGLLTLLGMTAGAPSSSVSGTTVTISVTLTTNSHGDEIWPTEDALKYATRSLFGASLAIGTPAKFTAQEPVVS